MKRYILKIVIFPFILTFFITYIYSTSIIFKEKNSVKNLYMKSSNLISNEPTINARNAIIFDRYSKKTIYGKKETEICKMASTTNIVTT